MVIEMKLHNLFILILFVFLTACTSINKQNSLQKSVQTIGSGKLLFDNVAVSHQGDLIKVSGDVRKKSQATRRVVIPGHIHLILMSKQKQALQTMTANTHRKYANSKVWHFDGMFKTAQLNKDILNEATIVVKYHDHH